MKASKVIDILTKKAPVTESWIANEAYGPYSVNSNSEVKNALYCVTPTPQVVEEFETGNYDLLLCHHPYIRKGVPQIILHTALDCCKGGLNDQWRDALGVKNGAHFDKNLGWAGEIDPISFEDLRKKVNRFIGQPTEGIAYSDQEKITSVVICTGLGGMVEWRAKQSGADCYITGELTSDPLRSPFKSIIEVGHTLSEYKTGLNFMRKNLSGVQVFGADLDNDYFSNEVYVPPPPVSELLAGGASNYLWWREAYAD